MITTKQVDKVILQTSLALKDCVAMTSNSEDYKTITDYALSAVRVCEAVLANFQAQEEVNK